MIFHPLFLFQKASQSIPLLRLFFSDVFIKATLNRFRIIYTVASLITIEKIFVYLHFFCKRL